MSGFQHIFTKRKEDHDERSTQKHKAPKQKRGQKEGLALT